MTLNFEKREYSGSQYGELDKLPFGPPPTACQWQRKRGPPRAAGSEVIGWNYRGVCVAGACERIQDGRGSAVVVGPDLG
jgi:hypothetical protein